MAGAPGNDPGHLLRPVAVKLAAVAVLAAGLLLAGLYRVGLL